jgi:hypothetical protein
MSVHFAEWVPNFGFDSYPHNWLMVPFDVNGQQYNCLRIKHPVGDMKLLEEIDTGTFNLQPIERNDAGDRLYKVQSNSLPYARGHLQLWSHGIWKDQVEIWTQQRHEVTVRFYRFRIEDDLRAQRPDGDAQRLIDELNSIYIPQTNIAFTWNSHAIASRILGSNDIKLDQGKIVLDDSCVEKFDSWYGRVYPTDFVVVFVPDFRGGKGTEAMTIGDNGNVCILKDQIDPHITLGQIVGHEAGHWLGIPWDLSGAAAGEAGTEGWLMANILKGRQHGSKIPMFHAKTMWHHLEKKG